MKKIILIIVAIVYAGIVRSQDCGWAKKAGGTFDESGTAVCKDSDGNIIVAGIFESSTITFGTTTLTHVGSGNASNTFVVKYDPQGNVLWAKGILITATANAITTDTSNNVYVTGSFSGTLTFGSSTITSAGSTDVFLAKYNSSGFPIWAKKAGGSSAESALGIVSDLSGKTVITGRFSSTTAAFGSFNLTSNATSDNFFIAKFDTAGTVLWAKQAGQNSRDDGGNAVTIDEDGNIYATGYFESSPITFGSVTLTATSTSTTDLFLVKYTSAGVPVWAKKGGSTGDDEGRSITVDNQNNIFITGSYSNNCTIGDTTLSSLGLTDILIAKYDSAGNFIWVRTGGGSSSDYGNSLTMDLNNNLIVAGQYLNSITTNSTSYFGAGLQDLFIAKYDTSGNELWLKRAGENAAEITKGVTCDNSGNIYATGSFRSSKVYIGTDSLVNTTATSTEMFLVKFPETPLFISYSNVICNGENNGSAIAIVSNTATSYSYSWTTSPIQTNDSAINLSPGNYHVFVIDNLGCKEVESVIISEPAALAANGTSVTNKKCSGVCNGSATLGTSVTGGVTPYTYLWDINAGSQTTSSATNLCAGTYDVLITDANGCILIESITVAQQVITATTSSVVNSRCAPCNGTATVTGITGATSPYTYLWDNAANNQTTVTASTLCAGSYQVTITDASGCTKQQNVTVGDQPPPAITNATVSITNNSKCSGVSNGSATITNVTGGTTPITYQWDSLAGNQTTATISTMPAGHYDVTITDLNGCTLVKNVIIGATSNVSSQVSLSNIAAVDMVNVDPAFAQYYVYELPNVINPNASNPLNLTDPGKYARFKVQSKNTQTNGQSLVSAICKVRTNSPYLTITDSSSALNNVAWNGKSWSADEFEIYIDPSTPSDNVYLDFVVEESTNNYATTCIAIPVRPMVYTNTTSVTIDDDNNPDSNGDDDNIVDPNEIVEFYPWLNSLSDLNAEYVRGSFENLDSLDYISIWDNHAGVNTTVYKTTWWNYAFGQPQQVPSGSLDMKPEYDFVFEYDGTNYTNNFNLYLVMTGGFNLFNSSALSLVKWSLPYNFTSTYSPVTNINTVANSELMVYPNPSKDKVYINGLKKGNYEVINSLGQRVRSFNTENNLSVTIENLENGVYYIKAVDTNMTTGGKFIILK